MNMLYRSILCCKEIESVEELNDFYAIVREHPGSMRFPDNRWGTMKESIERAGWTPCFYEIRVRADLTAAKDIVDHIVHRSDLSDCARVWLVNEHWGQTKHPTNCYPTGSLRKELVGFF